MAQPAWKRPGSPIGRTGARKAHPKYKQRAGQPWSSEEVKKLRTLARGKYTDRSAELETATAARRDPQQGATRRYIAEAHKPFAL